MLKFQYIIKQIKLISRISADIDKINNNTRFNPWFQKGSEKVPSFTAQQRGSLPRERVLYHQYNPKGLRTLTVNLGLSIMSVQGIVLCACSLLLSACSSPDSSSTSQAVFSIQQIRRLPWCPNCQSLDCSSLNFNQRCDTNLQSRDGWLFNPEIGNLHITMLSRLHAEKESANTRSEGSAFVHIALIQGLKLSELNHYLFRFCGFLVEIAAITI